ncbi:PB1 domain-containing protein [Artemisia annua]|uniref:PB1 domain-containing protein n=1 Tax=Artemisia annua TaxID=35608 RepID=A0A2U1NZW3_ARTAN|nr:PB1 domain-containing protein [Artemisia annua]
MDIYSLWVLFMAYIIYTDETLDSRIKRVLDNFDFQGESGLLQFWRCSSLGDPDDIGCSLTLADQFCLSIIHDSRLMDYRMRCFLRNPFIGLETNVGNWFAGRAAQTGVGDHRTRRVVLNQDHHYVEEAPGMGQLVVPVFSNNSGTGLTFAGIIELVTIQPKESYVVDFSRIQDLLMMVNLTSTYMGKTMKVKYNDNTVKFTLPFLAKLPDLQEQVTMRFKELKNKTFCIKYEDTNLNLHSILSDQDLDFCIAESISNRTTVIRIQQAFLGDRIWAAGTWCSRLRQQGLKKQCFCLEGCFQISFSARLLWVSGLRDSKSVEGLLCPTRSRLEGFFEGRFCPGSCDEEDFKGY